MSEASEQRRRAPRPDARRARPRMEDALTRARDHARAAFAEATLAARCLLDAASLGATGVPAEAHEALRQAAHWLDRVAAAASTGAAGDTARWMTTVAVALDAEIMRWEARSRVDPEARAVLRAFLSVRELLWEFGLRSDPEAIQPEPAPRAARPRTAAHRQPRHGGSARLERVQVDGEDAAEPAGRPG